MDLRREERIVVGPSFAPDWDGGPLADVLPRHTHTPLTFTWNGLSFLPGRLDYVIYAPTTLVPQNRFVLDTAELPSGLLSELGLLATDSTEGSDHLALVADFALPN